GIEYIRKPTLDWLRRQQQQSGKQEKKFQVDAILDPPREGLKSHDGKASDYREQLERLGVGRAILVGCDPDAWARDVFQWLNGSWELVRVAVFDFFPQTPHVETAGLLVYNR
ncbi:MAG: hypothetical protein AAB425_15495, partial [Bdellovibrionota bacterium]